MRLAHALGVTVDAERALAGAFRDVARRHADEPDVRDTARLLAGWSRDHARALAPAQARLGMVSSRNGRRLRRALFRGRRADGIGLLEDLRDLMSCVAFVEACWTVLLQAALASSDSHLERTCRASGAETLRQRAWLETKLAHVAPQALVVPPPDRPGAPQVPEPPRTAAGRRAGDGVPLLLGMTAGVARVLTDRRRRHSSASAVSPILAGLALGWAGSVVGRALLTHRDGRPESAEPFQGLRGPTRTSRLLDPGRDGE
jgi:hypothetical protein